MSTIIVVAILLLVFSGSSSSAEGAKKTIVMGTSPDYAPYESVDAKGSGEIVGLDIDIAKAIADKLGYELQISGMDFNSLIAALQTGRVDFVMSAMSVTDERKQSVDFSKVYYVARNTIISKANHNYGTLEELSGKRIGVQLGSTQETVAASIKNAEIKKLNKIPDMIQEIKSGRIDAAIVEDAVALGNTTANPDLKFTMIPSGDGDEDQGYSVAFPKGSPLVDEFNEALQELEASGEKEAIVTKWFDSIMATTGPAGGLNLDFTILRDYMNYMMKGIYVTLLFTLVSALFGFVWGAILSLFKISHVRPLQWFATAYTSVFRGTPLLLQLFLIYFATPQLLDYDISPLLAAGLAFGLNSAAYLSETIRAGIMAVDRGQREAAMALGIPYRTMMISIIFPQAVKNILPALVNECVALLKESSLVSVIGVQDLMRRATVVQANTYRAFEALLFVGVIYYVLVLILTSLARVLERRLRRSD
ncbi:ABC transporter substrate-binding protein/permease [Paenibacillus oenotherae]|uniref:ABC transporter substrate-binding protein/permease n=2 Tax=Paenibacillus oenotherae TaxID=1435645 RepID=A0ABS7D5Q7_9BACL|nr:ABC transporter substrate-binding protein/permease [Paenibacillus oenotherae]